MSIQSSWTEAVGHTQNIEEAGSVVRDPQSKTARTHGKSFGQIVAQRFVERLGTNELRRRMVHMSMGLIPFITWNCPKSDMLSLPWRIVILTAPIVLAIAVHLRERSILRAGEKSCMVSVYGFMLTVPPMFFLFPASPELGLTVLSIIALGDGFATLMGMLFRGPTLPWNSQKTWVGTLSFLAFGIPLSALSYWGEARPVVPFTVALSCAGVATAVAAIAESLPSRINDNIRVGVAAAAALVVAHGIFVGW